MPRAQVSQVGRLLSFIAAHNGREQLTLAALAVRLGFESTRSRVSFSPACPTRRSPA